HESFTINRVVRCRNRANEANPARMAVVSGGPEVATRANEAILHESFTIRRGTRDRNRENEAKLATSCLKAWMHIGRTTHRAERESSIGLDRLILARRLIPLQAAGEGFGGVFKVDGAAVAGSGAGGRGVQEQGAHHDDAPGRDDAVDRTSIR